LTYLAPIRSELKLKILLQLLKGSKNLQMLKSSIDARETSILHVLKEFEGAELTTKSGGVYSLTSLGLIDAQICSECLVTSEVMEKFKDLWLSHDLTVIPPHLIRNLGYLKDSTLIRTDSFELSKVHKAFLQILLTSKRIRGISPIFHPDYVPVIEHLLSQGNQVELILTKAVLEKTLSLAKLDSLKKDFKDERLKIYLKENLKVALTVTEKNFSLGFFDLNGVYDYSVDLISLNQEAIAWGEELFLGSLKDSGRIGIEDLG